MNYGLEQIAALIIAWLSMVCIAVSVFGSLCALDAVWAARRFSRRPATGAPTAWPNISILKPLFRAETQLAENIETYFHQDYPGKIQFVFGVQDANDSAIPVVRSLIARHPELDIELVVNAATYGSNRKVANLINMAEVARYPVVVAADSDIAVGPNYLRTLAATLMQPGVGAVTCLYRGLPSNGFWSRMSAMAVDDHFLPTTILGLALGLARPCLGATIALSRETLSQIGGFETVANQLADDYAIGKAVREAGLNVIVSPMLVVHAFEEETLHEMVRHELRWARTIFAVDPVGYIGSGLTHALPMALIGAALRGVDSVGVAAILGALASRLFLKYRLARQFELSDPNYALLPVRDMLSFAIYLASFSSTKVAWRGQDFAVGRDGTLLATLSHGSAQQVMERR
jgi:ceramide glucosyltransferase